MRAVGGEKFFCYSFFRLKDLSGLSSDQITHLGHSLGARVALQAATMTNTPPNTLILLGTQVNLGTNQQAEFFTGTSDADLEWVQALGAANPRSDVILFSGTWDDILTTEAANQLAQKLSESTKNSNNVANFLILDPLRIGFLYPKLLHNYEIYTTAFEIPYRIFDQIDFLGTNPSIKDLDEKEKMLFLDKVAETEFKRIYGKPPSFNNLIMQINGTIGYWVLGLAGLFLALISGIRLIERKETTSPEAKITKLGWFIGGKLLLWIPALIPGAVIASAVFFTPLGTPAFNLYYIGFFGGYGVLMWFLYLKGRVPGVEGKLLLKGNPGADEKKAYLAGFVFLAVLLAVSLMARSGWWYTFPFNHRFIWLLVFTPITALGFMIGYKEIEIIQESQPLPGWLVWVNALVGLFPFFVYTTFLAALGSISGVVGSIQGLVILALAICTGTLVEKISARPWLAAMLQAFLLYWLILPQGVLFR